MFSTFLSPNSEPAEPEFGPVFLSGFGRFFLQTPNQGSALSFIRTPNRPNQGWAHSYLRTWVWPVSFSELRTRVRPGPFSEPVAPVLGQVLSLNSQPELRTRVGPGPFSKPRTVTPGKNTILDQTGSLQPCGHLLAKGLPLGSPVCDVFLCFCHFPIWCPGSGVVFDCIDSWSLPFSYFVMSVYGLWFMEQLDCCVDMSNSGDGWS